MILLENTDKSIFPFKSDSQQYQSYEDFVLKTFGGLNNTDLDKITYEKFCTWKEKSPKLSEDSYPYTYRYVKDEKDKDTNKIKDELKDIEFFLDENQTIFHGGIFLSDSPKIGDEITTMEIFSTTIDPYTASLHAIQEEKECLWIIKLNQKTKCLPVNIETLEESEIIIIDSLKLKITNITSLSKIDDFGIKRKMDCIFLEQI
ncbi:MAG: hypothetical protein IJV35_00885 [Neisseriaceae bacterium]|nr:hypothetical protein [Neisseriaceae bacterium]